MSQQELILVVQFSMGLGLIALALWMYRQTKVDRFREDLFITRDELFDFARVRGVPFDLPAYALLRDSINGGIRISADITLPLFAVMSWHVRRSGPHEDKIETAIAAVEDEQVRKHLTMVRAGVSLRLMQFLFLKGPISLITRTVRRLSLLSNWARSMLYPSADRWTEEFAVFGSQKRSSPLPRLFARHGRLGWIR